MAVRWRLGVAYDGAAFHGFAPQADPDLPTVAGALQRALVQLCRLESLPLIVCAGRTDAGVHALGQVVHVELPDGLPVDRRGETLDPQSVVAALNRKLSPAVRVTAAAVVPSSFDARRSASARHYRYLVDEGWAQDPLLRQVAFHVEPRLDLDAMAQATVSLLGEHDFRAFCRRVPGTAADAPLPRRVLSASWRVEPRSSTHAGAGRLLRMDISANAFCHQMVRSIVGQLVAVGQGRAEVSSLERLLAAGSRLGAAQPAPGHGLCLVAVDYDGL